ncbi:hypothetical protein Fmac_007952 [Flemingia macrophylla]|uniref:Uncharacterized protein n=1 Tax=Flemingia macrophylla TaxID=520843 RepID=A0ABD1MW21_9FABA
MKNEEEEKRIEENNEEHEMKKIRYFSLVMKNEFHKLVLKHVFINVYPEESNE